MLAERLSRAATLHFDKSSALFPAHVSEITCGQGLDFVLREGVIHSKSRSKRFARAMASGVLEWYDPDAKTLDSLQVQNIEDIAAALLAPETATSYHCQKQRELVGFPGLAMALIFIQAG